MNNTNSHRSADTQFQPVCHYLPVTTADVEWGAYVVGAGRHISLPRDSYPPQEHPSLYHYTWRTGRTLPEYRLTLITAGKGTFESEASGAVEIEGPTLLLVFPNVWHRYRPNKSTGWTERWISANGTQFHRLYETHGIKSEHAIFRPVAGTLEQMLSQFDLFLDRIHSRPAQNSRLLSLHALSLFGDLLEPIVESEVQAGVTNHPLPKKIDDPVILAALEYIWTRSHRPLSVNDVARQLTVSRRTLDRRFANVVGHSVLDEINLCRIGRAKRFLRETDLPIKAIAHLAGFGSREGMRVAFRSFIHTSPRKWREGAKQDS